jgi:hypothetical protein
MRLADKNDDVGVLEAIATHPSVKKAISDDFSTGFKVNPEWEYLLFGEEGFIAVQPLNYICYQLHIAMLPSMAGKGAASGYEAGWWLFHNSPCQKLVAIFPEFNKGAKRVVEACGMVQEGILTKSFSKGYNLYNQYIYGITKGEALCQQQQREAY